MGCWNETCGVTQLPIHHGDKVRVFVIYNSPCWRGEAGGGTCYSTDRWTPVGPPVQGNYDDYGGVEKIKHNADSKFLMEVIRENWIPVEDEKDEKIPSAADLTLEEALHFIERDRAQYRASFTPVTLGIMFVLEDVYQAMIDYNPIEAHHLEDSYRYRPLKEIYQADIENWYKASLVKFAKFEELSKLEDKETRIELLSLEMSFDLADDRIFSWSESGRGSAARPYKNKLKGMAKKKVPFEDKKVQAACNTVVEMLLFCNAMSTARKMWTPQSGKGGQHRELGIYKKLNETTAAIMAKRDKEDEENGCEVDAEGYSPWMREHNEKAK